MTVSRKYIIIGGVLALMAGCDGSPDTSTPPEKTAAEKIADLEASGALPVLDRSDSIQGPDADANGVRDDVDAFIAKTYPTESQRAAAHQFAANVQEQMLVSKDDKGALRAVDRRLVNAGQCIHVRFTDEDGNFNPFFVREKITAISTNTKARLLAYLAYSKAMDGAAIGMATGDTCE